MADLRVPPFRPPFKCAETKIRIFDANECEYPRGNIPDSEIYKWDPTEEEKIPASHLFWNLPIITASFIPL